MFSGATYRACTLKPSMMALLKTSAKILSQNRVAISLPVNNLVSYDK